MSLFAWNSSVHSKRYLSTDKEISSSLIAFCDLSHSIDYFCRFIETAAKCITVFWLVI